MDERSSGTAGSAAPARRSRRVLPWLAAAGGVAVLVTAAVAVPALTREDPVETGEAAAVGAGPGALCGVADAGVYSAVDGPEASPLDPIVSDLGGTVPGWVTQLQVSDDGVVVLGLAEDGVATFASFEDGGSPRGEFSLPPAEDRASDTFALTDEGMIVTASRPDGDAVVAGYTSDGDQAWQSDLASLDRGPVAAVFRWSAGDADAVAAVAFWQSDTLALIGPDGAVDPGGPRIPLGEFFPQEDGELVVRVDVDEDDVAVQRYSAAGELLSSFGGPASTGSPNGGPATVGRPRAITQGPDGGYLLVDHARVVEVGDDGVWRRMIVQGETNGAAAVDLADGTPLVRHHDHYYFVITYDEGRTALVRVDVAGMNAMLDAPETYQISTAATQDRLGYGAGLVTDAPYGYYAAGEAPSVSATFDQWWGAVAEDYLLRYTVTGDPWASPGIEPTSGEVDLPARGGDVALDLPPARAGAYDVHAELVERSTGEVRTATCLRYAVGGPDTAFDPTTLAEGADWGGPKPLRGVQLADQLGIGSYRLQLDFSRLVPDVDATPGVDGLDLTALPGAADGDPWADVAAAAALAERLGVTFYVQVGQGGGGELAAVENGSWGAWVEAIATAFAEAAPETHVWAPWNEPNNTGFGDGADYARQVLAPFAQAVRTVDPSARVVGGNALGVNVDWYRAAFEAGACDALDVVGIHPYTGFNRSWDEEGEDGPIGQIAALDEALGACGTDRPEVWNTESGWWSDGPANQWGQAYDVARTMLWQRYLGVTEWTYFFSEGGWGEGGFSWSLLQMEDFVKPGALAMAAVSATLEPYTTLDVVDAGIPFTTVMHGSADDGAHELLAVWTDDLVGEVTLTSDAAADVDVVDVYGNRTTLAVDGEATLAVSGAPLFVLAPAGSGLAVGPASDPGPDLLASGSATASSSKEGTDPAAVLGPGGAGANPWRAALTDANGEPDAEPWIQVDLDSPATIDRVVVESAGIRCCTSGLRDYTVSVETPEGEWIDVGEQSDLFLARTAVTTFEPVEAVAVRVQVGTTTERGVTVPALNYSGQTGGLHPAWITLEPDEGWTMSVVALAAYGPP